MQTMLTSPIGDLTVQWNEEGRVDAIRLPGAVLTAAAMEPPAPAGRVIEQLCRYLAGEAVVFSSEDIALPGTTPFTQAVYAHVFAIPAGETRTYGQVAGALGKAGAARAVGNAMARNPLPLIVPCHRVLATQGLGGYASGLDHKRFLLELEGALLPVG